MVTTKHWFHQYLLEHYSKGKTLGLDIGSGLGNYQNDFQCRHLGMDLLSYYGMSLKPEIYGDAAFLPFRDDVFDLVVSYSVVPYIKYIDNSFDEMHRVLRPGGIALIVIMNLKGLSLQPETHFWNRYTSKQLGRKLAEHRFKSVIGRNLKASFWSKWFDITSVYAYAVVTPVK